MSEYWSGVNRVARNAIPKISSEEQKLVEFYRSTETIDSKHCSYRFKLSLTPPILKDIGKV